MGRERLGHGNRVGFLSTCCEDEWLGVLVAFASCSASFYFILFVLQIREEKRSVCLCGGMAGESEFRWIQIRIGKMDFGWNGIQTSFE